MHIESPQPNSALRLVHPPQPDPTGKAASSAQPAPQKDQATRHYSFEAVYLQQLPRIDLTDAHRRLDRIRSELVAGRTPTPIHFDHPATPPTTAPAKPDPYAHAYMKLTPPPADAHARATEAAAE